ITRNDVIQVDDYADADFQAQPAKARSALAVPIMFGEQVIGVIHLFSNNPHVFNKRVIEFLLALTDQATVAIGNHRRYQEQIAASQSLRIRAERMGRIFELGEMFRQGASLTEMLEEVAHSIQETVGFNVVMISLVDDRAGLMRRTAQAGLPLAVFQQLQQTTPPLEQARGLLQEQYRVSNSYFLPAEGATALRDGLPVFQSMQERMTSGPRGWDPEDLLLVPIYGAGKRLMGLISVDEPQSGRRPDLIAVEALEIFANQAAFSIENYRLIERIQHEAEATRRERDRLAQLHLVASEIQRAPDVPSRLQVVAKGIHDAGWGHVVITLRDEHLEPTALIQSGYSPEEAMRLSDEVQPGSMWRAWINDLAFYETKLGAGYYLRYQHPWVVKNIFKGKAPESASVPDDTWHPLDVFYLPLVGQDQKRIIGIIAMDEPADGRVPTVSSLQPFELFASQAAAAIETTRLYQETVRAAEQEQRINEVMEAVSASTNAEAVIQMVGRGLQQMVPFTRMSVALYNDADSRFNVLGTEIALDSSVTVKPAEALPVLETATGQVFLHGTSRLYELGRELTARETLTDLRGWYGTGERSTMLVPMIAGGQPVGVLRLGSELENAFRFVENTDLIQRLANLLAVSLQNAHLFSQAQQRAIELDAQARRLTVINRVSSRLAQSLDPREIYQIALNELQDLLSAQFGGVVILEDESTGLLMLDTHPGLAQSGPVRIDLVGNQTFKEMRETLRPVVAEDVKSDPRFAATLTLLEVRGTQALLLIPLLVNRQLIGSIGLDFTARRSFSEPEIELAQTIGSQVSVALDKANLLHETEQRAIELNEQTMRLTILNRMSTRLAQTIDPQAIYKIVLEETQQALGCQYSGLMLVLPEQDLSKLVLSTHPQDYPLPDLSLPLKGNPIAEYMMATRQPVVAEDLLNDPRFEAMWAIEEARNTRAMLIVPMVMGDRLIGTMGLDSATPRKFSPGEVGLAMTAANQAAVAIENARLFTEAQQRAIELDAQAQRLALVNRVSSRLAQTLDQHEIYSIVVSEMAEMLNVEMAGLVLFEGENTGRLMLSYPFNRPTPDLVLRLEGNRSIEIVRATRKPLVSTDVLTDPVFEAAWDVLRVRGTRSLMIVPLVVGEKVVGTIGLDATALRTFTDAEVELAETIASQASLAVEKARLYNETLNLTIFNQAVVESIQQGIVVLDRDLIVRRVNRFMVERFGWVRSAVDQHLFEYRPDYGLFLRAPMAVALGMGEPQVQYEVERRDEEGKPSIRNYYVYPMVESRQVTGLVLLIEDVTESTRLASDLEIRAVQMAALSQVSSQITATLERGQVIQVILDALERVIPYDGVALWLRNPDKEELSIVAARGYDDADATGVAELIGLKVEIPYSPLFGEMAQNTQVINVGDVSAGDPRFPYGSAAVYKNWLGAPLVSKGQVVGVIALEKREPHFYTPLFEQLAFTFANQAAVALDNASLFDQTRARASALDEQARRLALLNRVSLALAQTLDLENIYEIALRETAIALNVNEGAAIMFETENPLGVVVVEYPRGDAPPERVFDLTQNEAFDRARNGLIPLVIDNTGNDVLAVSLRRMLRHPDVKRSLFVPLVVGGEVIGVLRLDVLQTDQQFSIEQVELAQTIASQAAVAVQNATLFEQAAIRRRELETLFESAQATAVTLDLDEVVRRVAMQMITALMADACSVFLWDDVNNRLEVRGEISSHMGEEGEEARGKMYSLVDYPLRERALRDRELIVVRMDDEALPVAERQLLVRHNAACRLLVPLVVNEISIGLVEIETLDPHHYYKSDSLRLARTLASQAAISIENARLQTETRRTVEELYVINDMSGALSSANSLQQLLDVIDLQLPNLIEGQFIYVALYDSAANRLSFPLVSSIRGTMSPSMPDRELGSDEFSTIIKRQAPLLLVGENIADVRRSLGIESIIPETLSFVGVPLFGGEEVIGVLAARDDLESFAFSYNDQRTLNTVGAQLGVAIQSTRLFQQTLQLAEELDQRVQIRTAELERERQSISTLYAITTELASGFDMDRLLHRSLEMVAQAVGAGQGAIMAVDPISDRLYFRASLGAVNVPASNGGERLSIGVDEGLAGWAIQNRQSVLVDDVQSDSRWLRVSEADDLPRAGLVALIEQNEDVLGVIMLYSDTPGSFSQSQLQMVTAAANQVANAMNNAELYGLIRDQAERLGSMLRQEQVEATKNTAIFDSVADGVMVTDGQGRVSLFNSAASRVLRLAPQNVLGRASSEIAGLYGAGKTRWAETVNEWMEDPTALQPGEFLEEQIRLEDERVISVRVSPVNMGDQFLGTVSIFRDITREVEVDRLKSEFVATVSHELRTPMTSIKGYADLLLLGAAGEISEQQHRFLDTIKQNADRLSILVNDLLDISRIDQNRMELRFAPVEVEDVLNAVAVHVRSRCQDENREMNVVIELPDDQHLTVWGDYDKVNQIISNLADNAFNYTPAGGLVTLKASPSEDTAHVVFAVADTGIGISPEISDRVFERFFRGDEAHELVMDTPGTGLGLAIVRELVQVHNGRIWFESEVGKGTTFYVELPSKASQTASD
ncbi:MAG: GAF domain-containing protein, partial [Chloroflexi bacterium]|nr:GAF domain-containing protein [Chloroflexota bacterium]